MKLTQPQTQSADRTFSGLAAMVLLAAVPATLVAGPFWKCILLAGVMAAALNPLHGWLTTRLHNRKKTAAAMLTVGVLIAVLAPIALASVSIAKEAGDAVKSVRQATESASLTDLLHKGPLQGWSATLQGYAQRFNIGDDQLRDAASSAAGMLQKVAGAGLATSASAPIYGALTLFVFYFLLIDGSRLRPLARDVLPLRPAQTHALLDDLRQVAQAALLGNVVTALSQALIVGLGLWGAGTPYPLLCALLAIPVSFIPVAGSALVWVPIAAGLAVQSQWGTAACLLAWCTAGSMLNTNVVKPYIVGSRVRMHGALTFVSILGGVKLLGMIGILAGPLAMTLFCSLVTLYRREQAPESNLRVAA